MKKLLALVLALVMTLSLCVTSNAAYDGEEFDYDEAVEVMSAVGVFQGDENGKFNGNDNLTRAQAAKIIAYLDLGNTAAEALTKDVTAFSDVAAGNWAAGYITYCYNAGIIAGVGDGMFAPNAQVTALQFAKMLLVVLGYKADVEGLTGADWTLNTAKLAAENALFDGNDDVAVNAPATREEAAQYCLNALKADCVKYATGTTTVKGKDIEVTVGGSAAAAYAAANDDTAGFSNLNTLQLGEKLYKGKLYFSESSEDDMNRPATTWTYKNVTVGTYANAPKLTFVVSKTTKTYAQLIKAANSSFTMPAEGSDDIVYVNNKTVGVDVDTAGEYGDVVEVYLNSTVANQVKTVVVTRYSSAKVTGAVATKTVDGELQVRVPGVVTAYKAADEVHGYEGLAKNDVVYYYTDGVGDYYLAKAASFEGKLSAASNSDAKKVTVDGTAYVINGNTSVTPSFNTTYTFYTDNNGYIVYAIEEELDTLDFVVIQAIGPVAASGVTNTTSAEARLVAMDGTTKVVTVDSVKVGGTTYTGTTATSTQGTNLVYKPSAEAINTNVIDLVGDCFFSYTTDSNGDYALTAVSGDYSYNDVSGKTITAKAAMDNSSTITFNDKTVFIVAKSANGKTFDVYTGKNNVPSMNTVSYSYVAKNGVALYVFVDSFSSKDITGETIYIFNGTGSSKVQAKKDDGSYYYYVTMKALVNDEIGEVKVNTDSSYNVSLTGGATLATGYLVTPTYDPETGVITTVSTSSAKAQSVAYSYSYDDGTLLVNDNRSAADIGYTASDDTVLYYKDSDGNYVAGTMAEYDADDNDAIYVVTKGTSGSDANTVAYAYVQYVDDATVAFSALKYNTTAITLTAGAGAVENIGSNNITFQLADTCSVASVKLNGTAGTVSQDAAGLVTYDPSATGVVTFTITAVDGTTASFTVTLTGSVS